MKNYLIYVLMLFFLNFSILFAFIYFLFAVYNSSFKFTN